MPDQGSRNQLTILDAMFLIAGVAFGLWLFGEKLKSAALFTDPDDEDWILIAVSMLSGISVAGTPLILTDRLRSGRRWRSGTLHWLALGLACWAFLPALVMLRLNLARGGEAAYVCFLYSVPLMGLFLLLATLIGGRPINRWWRCRGWWPEWFGMWMLVGWSVTGSYVLFIIYRDLF